MTPTNPFTNLIPDITSADVRQMFAWGSLAFGLFSLYRLADGLITRTVVTYIEFWDTPVLTHVYERDSDPITLGGHLRMGLYMHLHVYHVGHVVRNTVVGGVRQLARALREPGLLRRINMPGREQ